MRQLLFALALFGPLAACARGEEAPPASGLDRAAVEEIVRSYILENPEIIEEAVVELQRRALERQQQTRREAIDANADAIFGDARDPVVGPDDAKVTVVEFLDYRCPFCTRTNEWVQATLAAHPDDVRFIFKEFAVPIAGEESVRAARAALAVWRIAPQSYAGFHDDLITARGPLPLERILDIAAENGVDAEALSSEMQSEEIGRQIEDVRTLARRIGVTGTPFFIIGDEIVPEADMAALERTLAAALAE